MNSTPTDSRRAIGPPSRPDASDLFAELVDQLASQFGRGTTPDLDAMCREHPAHAARLRNIFPALQAAHAFVAEDGQQDDESPLPKMLGGFELIRQIGRGGMGVVYLAQQRDLKRQVAIKVLPFAALLDQRQLERFKLEARAAAMLKHPRIVSVFAFDVQQGIHYYVMEYIDGVSLDEVIAAWNSDPSLVDDIRHTASSAVKLRPFLCARDEAQRAAKALSDSSATPLAGQKNSESESDTETKPVAQLSTRGGSSLQAHFQSVARLGVEVASALHFAHEHGVVHRDIKPSNVMLDHDGNPVIADFGLARIHSGENLTVSGDTLGTLRYMSPEQLSNQGVVDGRTDVYSLGLTLYELLARTPALGSADRRDSRGELLQQVLHNEPRPLQHVVPQIPRDLATIVHKAAAKQIDERYPTAAALADDLQAFLDQRPIQARPSTQLEHAIRFSKRNPQLASLVAVSFLLLLSLAGLSSLLAWNYRAQTLSEAQHVASIGELGRLQRIGLYARDMRAAKQAADETNLIELQEILLRWVPKQVKVPDQGESPKQLEHEDLRGFEWYHLWQLCEDPAVVRSLGHELTVYQSQFLPDGKRLASSDFAESLRIWSLTEGSPNRPIKNLHSPSMNVFAVTVDAKRSWLLFGDARGNVNIYDSNAYEPVDQFRLKTDAPYSDDVQTLSVNDAGTQIAIGAGNRDGGTVFVREFADQRSWLLAELPGTARAMFAADNELFVSGRDLDEIRVYHPGEASESDTTRFDAIPLGAQGSTAMAISPDKTLLALGVYDKGRLDESYRVEIWSTLWRQRLWTRQVSHRVRCVAFSTSGKQLAWGDQSGRVSLAEVPTDASLTKLVMRRKVSGSQLNDVSFSPDEQQLATSGADAFTMIWDLSILRDGPKQVVELNRDFVFASGGCFLDRAGRQAAVTCRNVGLVTWDSRSGSVIAEKQSGAETDLRRASFVKVASAADIGIACVVCGQWPFEPGDKTPVLIWDNTMRDFVGQVDIPVSAANSPSSCHMSHDGKFLAVSTHENGAYIINVERRQIDRVLDIASKSVRFSADGSTFACGLSNGLVQLYSAPDFRPEERVQMDERLVDCIDLSSDGRMLAAVGFDRRVKLYDRDTQDFKAFEDRIPVFPCMVRFSPDGERILTGSLDGKIRLWITETGDQLLNWRFKADSWPVAEFSQAGGTILVAGVDICHAIHATDQEQIQPLPVSILRSRACQQSLGKDQITFD